MTPAGDVLTPDVIPKGRRWRSERLRRPTAMAAPTRGTVVEVDTLRRGLLVLVASACVVSCALAVASSGAATGPTGSPPALVQQVAPSGGSVQVCSPTEKCVPTSPTNRLVPAAPVLTVGFLALGVVVLVDRRRRQPGPRITSAPVGIPLAVFRPPIAR